MNELEALFKGFSESYKEMSEKEINEALKGKSDDYKTGYLEGRIDGIDSALRLNDKIFKG